MSYTKFKDALNDFYKIDSNKKIHYEVAFTRVRDQWIEAGKLEELIKAVLANWDSGNCDDFIVPLETNLRMNGDSELFITLWKGILKHRLHVLSYDNSSEQRKYVLDGIVRMRRGLESFENRRVGDEVERLAKLEAAIKSDKRPKYPK